MTAIARRRRCQLAVPGSSMRKIESALRLGVDHVFLDLEDAVAPSMKPEARGNLVKAFNSLDWGTTVRCFRMNGLDTPWAYEDLITVVEAAGANIDTVMIPKVKYPRDVHFVETLLDQIEMKCGLKRKIGLELLIEEVEGIANVNAIAVSSPRIESLMFGLGDYTRSQGVDFREAFGANRTYVGDVWHYQRHAISVAAHVARVDFVDGPWPRIPDMDGFRRECHFARTVGAVGKWAIHPSQVPVATLEFSPTAQQIEIASRNIALIFAAQERGEGAIKSPEGGLLDIAAVPMLQQVLDKARFYGLPVPAHP